MLRDQALLITEWIGEVVAQLDKVSGKGGK